MSIDSSDDAQMQADADSEQHGAADGAQRHVGDDDSAREDLEEEADRPRAAAIPRSPSKAEIAQHELTHFPYRSWCEDCVRGRATGHKHSSIVGEAAESSVARVRMDYGYLKEDETVTSGEHDDATAATTSMTMLVMAESLCNSVWAYVVDGKGAASVEWLSRQLVSDIATMGLAKERIITKADQEASIVQLQN